MIRRSVFIIFLALASSQPQPPPEKELLAGCETVYNCFVPDTCTTDPPPAKFDDAVVVEVQKSTLVTKDCAAIIRFHSYTQYRVHVSIESLAASVSSIVFHHKSSGSSETVSFSCKNNNGEVEGGYTSSLVPSVDLMISKEDMLLEPRKSPLKCVFEVNQKGRYVIVDPSRNAKVHFKLDSTTSKESKADIGQLRCDPSIFNFKADDNVDPAESYAKIDYSPGFYGCKDKAYNQLQFRLDYETEYLKNEKEFTCDGEDFSSTDGIRSFQLPKGKIWARCMADVQFACDYEVNTIPMPSDDPNFTKLNQTKPIPPTQKGELNCPDSHPFIEVNKKAKIGAVFKCKNQGTLSQWTLIHEGKDIVVRKKGAVVRCAKELRCHEINKIPVSSVKKGTLKNHLPECHEGGTLKVSPSMETVKVSCNKETGHYEYKIGNKIYSADGAIFICEYPTKKDDGEKQFKEKKQSTAKTGGILIGVGVFVALLVVAFVLVAIPYCRMHYLKKRLMKNDKNEWDATYARKDNEKKAKKVTNGAKTSEVQEDIANNATDKKLTNETKKNEESSKRPDASPQHLSARQATWKLHSFECLKMTKMTTLSTVEHMDDVKSEWLLKKRLPEYDEKMFNAAMVQRELQNCEAAIPKAAKPKKLKKK